MSKYKRLPLVSGSGAYILSTGVHLLKGIAKHYVVDIDGEIIDGRQTMICVANGRWYGGGFNPVPDAQPDDGYLHVLVIKAVGLGTVAKVFGKFKKGQYKELPQYEALVAYFHPFVTANSTLVKESQP